MNGELVVRAYSPVSSNDDVGYFELVIKVGHPLHTEHICKRAHWVSCVRQVLCVKCRPTHVLLDADWQ